MKQELWTADMALGVPQMDASHQGIFKDLARLDEATDEEFRAAYPALIAKLELDFFGEEEQMEGIDFPGLKSHREQHAKVLAALHHVESRVRDGDVELGREANTLFPQWLMFHIATMDAALATALQLAGVGDAPVPS